MENLYQKFLGKIDTDFLMRETEALWKLEFGQTSKCQQDAARYTFELLKKNGLSDVELLEFPADGETAFLDVRSPMAWDASVGRLTLLNVKGSITSGDFGGPGPDIVAADYQLHPFTLVKGSVLEGGKRIVKILTESQILGGADPENSIVMLDAGRGTRWQAIKPILDLGAIGFISDAVSGGVKYPDSFAWFNAATEDGEWHVTAGHRPFVGFSVSPRMGEFIRSQCSGKTALVECDGRRYAGVHHVVTALVPGRRKEEVWAYGHLYEPMPDDDSDGVIAAIETARQIMAAGTPEYSVRLVFAMELYGYMAYIASRGGDLRGQVVGGVNYDGLASGRDITLKYYTCPGSTPCFGNLVMEALNDSIREIPKCFTPRFYGSGYPDDLSIDCPSIGIPAVWPISDHKDAHHTSRQTMETIDREGFAQGTAYDTALVFMLANPTAEMFAEGVRLAKKHVAALPEIIRRNPIGSDADRFDLLCRIERGHLAAFAKAAGVDGTAELRGFDEFCRETGAGLSREDRNASALWRLRASRIRMQYTDVGFPHSLVKGGDQAPPEWRGRGIYGILPFIIANLHREMTLAEAFRLAEYERGEEIPDEQGWTFLRMLNRMADWGYLRVIERPELTREEIVSRLKALGVKPGDVLLVHSSATKCGEVRGGAETIISALADAVGPEGTLLFPAFTRPYVFLGGPCREWKFRPYDSKDLSQIWTGEIPQTVLRTRKDALRSRHLSHSWCGFGPLAQACLAPHAPDDPPCGESSPVALAMEHGAKILHFGSALSSTTFLHRIEDECRVPFLGDAVCAERTADGGRSLHLLRRHLPGHRDFYAKDAVERKFYRAMLAKGLKIAREPLGDGELLLMDTRQYYELAVPIVREDFGILLCDDPKCAFCSGFRKRR